MIIMLSCHVCGHENPEKSKYCNRCGEKIIFREYVAPNYEEKKEAEIEIEDAESLNSKGAGFVRVGRYDEGIECFNKAIEMDPKNAESWWNKGVALVRLEMYFDAIDCFDKAIEIDLDYADAWRAKGIALELTGRASQAQQCYKRAKELGYEI